MKHLRNGVVARGIFNMCRGNKVNCRTESASSNDSFADKIKAGTQLTHQEISEHINDTYDGMSIAAFAIKNMPMQATYITYVLVPILTHPGVQITESVFKETLELDDGRAFTVLNILTKTKVVVTSINHKYISTPEYKTAVKQFVYIGSKYRSELFRRCVLYGDVKPFSIMSHNALHDAMKSNAQLSVESDPKIQATLREVLLTALKRAMKLFDSYESVINSIQRYDPVFLATLKSSVDYKMFVKHILLSCERNQIMRIFTPDEVITFLRENISSFGFAVHETDMVLQKLKLSSEQLGTLMPSPPLTPKKLQVIQLLVLLGAQRPYYQPTSINKVARRLLSESVSYSKGQSRDITKTFIGFEFETLVAAKYSLSREDLFIKMAEYPYKFYLIDDDFIESGSSHSDDMISSWLIKEDRSVKHNRSRQYITSREYLQNKSSLDTTSLKIMEGTEITSPILDVESVLARDGEFSQAMTKLISIKGLTFFNNNTTSNHVHISMKSLYRPKYLWKACRAWYIFEPIIMSMVIEPRRLNLTQFCVSMRSSMYAKDLVNNIVLQPDFDKVKAYLRGGGGADSNPSDLWYTDKLIHAFNPKHKINALNLGHLIYTKGTIEVRLKQGSADIDENRAWILFLVHFFNSALRIKELPNQLPEINFQITPVTEIKAMYDRMFDILGMTDVSFELLAEQGRHVTIRDYFYEHFVYPQFA